MKRIYILLFTSLFLISCSDRGLDVGSKFDELGWGNPDTPVVPDDPDDPGNSGDSDDDPARPAGKRCFIWIEGNANFKDYGDSRENIARDMEKIADCGFTDIVLDVRPAGAGGDVLFKTDKCQQVEFMGAWVDGNYVKVERHSDWDYLQAFIEEGHKAGLRVYAGFNTFCGGHESGLGQNGILFRDPQMRKHATVLNTDDGLRSIMNVWADEKFFNPVHPDVQNYIFGLLGDLAAYEDLDGIILDRGRFYDFRSDFSDYTRSEFEKYIGKKVTMWPEDVLPVGHENGDFVPSPKPQYFMEWIEFRAKVIHDFMEQARATVKGVNPDVDFGAYVGGWYEQYYTYGPNWASPSYAASRVFPSWATQKYDSFGFSDMLDVQIIGAYASYNAVYGNYEWSMQGFCRLAKEKTRNAPGLLIGGPDVGNWNWDGKATISQELSAVTQSVTACGNECDGYFLFDLCHLKLEPRKWDAAKEGISQLNN